MREFKKAVRANEEPIVKPGKKVLEGDAQILENYKTEQTALRRYILFNEELPQDLSNSKDMVDKQAYIRKALGLDSHGSTAEENLEFAFKIIDVVNY